MCSAECPIRLSEIAEGRVRHAGITTCDEQKAKLMLTDAVAQQSVHRNISMATDGLDVLTQVLVPEQAERVEGTQQRL